MMQIKAALQYGAITENGLRPFLLGKKILVLASPTVWKKSYIKTVIDGLADYYEFEIYTNIRPNAPFSDLQLVVDTYAEAAPDTIIAIGGGSVIDAAKALSVSFGGPSIEDLFYKKATMPKTSLPLIAIPTTAGTGAELSFGAIIFDDKNNVKGGIRGEVLQPNAVFIDEELYLTAPGKLISEVGFDCLTHSIETYLSLKSNGFVKYQSVAAIKTVIEFLPWAVKGDSVAMKNMSIASAMMGINLAYSSTCLPHRIQYVIGPLTNTSHAQGLIALYKGWIPLIGRDKKLSGLNELERSMGGNVDLIDEVETLKEKLNLNYSIASLGVRQDQIELILNKTSGSVQNDPCYRNNKTILEILEKSM